MASSGMLRRVDLLRIDVSEELSASFIRVIRIGELGTTLQSHFALLGTVRRLLVTANILEDDILHSHRHENLKYYITLTGWAL
jgi:hypothetical protein